VVVEEEEQALSAIPAARSDTPPTPDRKARRERGAGMEGAFLGVAKRPDGEWRLTPAGREALAWPGQPGGCNRSRTPGSGITKRGASPLSGGHGDGRRDLSSRWRQPENGVPRALDRRQRPRRFSGPITDTPLAGTPHQNGTIVRIVAGKTIAAMSSGCQGDGDRTEHSDTNS
jgi:hypothetical protein